MIFGQLILAFRQKHKLSRRELALKIGVDHVTLARIESNDVKAISLAVMGKLLLWAISEAE